MDLDKPSLGHWLTLLRSVNSYLEKSGYPYLLPSINTGFKDGAIYQAAQAFAPFAEIEFPKKAVKIAYFLDLIVQFRNKKIGHGSLSETEANTVVGVFETGLVDWLAGVNILAESKIVYVKQVTWNDPHFQYDGINLTSGASILPLQIKGSKAVTPKRIYLCVEEKDKELSLLPLYPFITYEPAGNLVYVYNELSKKQKPILRCPYESSPEKGSISLAVDSKTILGAESIGSSQKPAFEQDDVESDPFQKASPSLEYKEYISMKNWYDIITPHEDIRNGEFDEAIFAADLGDVASGNAPADYKDPYLFYKKTYPTQGLQNLLGKVYQILSTGKGSSVIQIQTPFGGGKTHALVAIYHYLKNGAQVQDLLPPGLGLIKTNVSAIAGNHWNPVEGFTSDSVTRRTFWGEMAYQIGGVHGYKEFQQNDEARVSPGKDKLRQFLEAHQPFVLLFDEILEYINRALDEKVNVKGKTGVSLGTQTYSFFQELTEAVSSIPKGMMIVTLPSSFIEDFSEKEEESLTRLNKIFGRLESIETPVQGEEVYAVIRRRLFEVEGMKTGAMREVVHGYFQLYQQHRDDLPSKVRDASYRDKMELAYPFHPDVIDILYEKWSTFPTFQRTRGVLRMLANVIEDLYQREAQVDLILPGDLNLGKPPIRHEFLKHIGQEYEGVIGSDISGHEAKSQLLDAANKSWKHLAQRISAAIFFHSFSADDATRGINLPYIKLAVLRSDTIPALATDVLGKLNNALWYLNNRGDSYFFSRIPNLNRMILDKKELFNESYEDEMRNVIQKELGNKFRPYLWPESSDGIADNRELKLLILRPEDPGSQIKDWVERRGNNFREYKNTLFFALADIAGFGKLREDIKTYLALKDIQDEIKSRDNSLLEGKREEVDTRIKNITRDYSYNVRRMYHVIKYGDSNGGRTLDLGQPVTGRETLDGWFWRELTSSDQGAILTQLHYRTIINKFMVQNQMVATGTLLDQFYKNPELPALSEQGVLTRAIQLGVEEAAFGLAVVQSGEILVDTLRFNTNIVFDAIPFDADTYLISRSKCEAIQAAILAQKQAEEEAQRRKEEEERGGNGGKIEVTRPVDIIIDVPGKDEPKPSKDYTTVHLVVSNVPASKIADVNRGILLPLSRVVGEFRFTIQIDVTCPDGISPATIENQIKETIRQIGAKITDERLE